MIFDFFDRAFALDCNREACTWTQRFHSYYFAFA